jgi:hypothetical protein
MPIVLEAVVPTNTQRITRLEAAVSDLTVDLSAVQGEAGELRAQVTGLVTLLDAANNTLARLLTQVETHDGFLTSLRVLVRDVDAVIAESLDEL